MHTSMLLFALTVQTSTQGAEISWSQDYSEAQKQCVAERKPMAVILGKGDQGYVQLIRDGGLSKEASDLLSTHYVCVFIDTATPKGKKLAEAFEMESGSGIVISDRTGAYQRYRYEGVLTNEDLARRLKIYTISSKTTTRTSNYSTNSATNSILQPAADCPTCQPAASYCPSCQGGGRYRR